MNIKEKISELVKKGKPKIGVCVINPNREIINSLNKASEYAEIVIIGSKIKGFENIPTSIDNFEKIAAQTIISKKVDALVKGQVDSYKFEDQLAIKGKYDRKKIVSSSVWEDYQKRSFLVTSASHADGWTIKHKKIMCDEGIKFLKSINIKPKLGFLTWVRPGSVGRNSFFDKTWYQAEKLVAYYSQKGYEAKNYNIEIEKALENNCNFIVFANGTSGNMFFRTMNFVNNKKPIIAFFSGIEEAIVPNSRNENDYYDLVLSAVALANRKDKE